MAETEDISSFDLDFNFTSMEIEEEPPPYVLVFFEVMLIVFGIPGNMLVLYVVLRNGAMKTVTNLYLVNLSIADLVFLVLVVPSHIMLLLSHPMHKYICKAYQYVLRVTLASSILTLVSMAADRYYGVMYPMKCRIHRTLRSSVVILACIWLIACTTQVPVIIYNTSIELPDGSWTMCIEMWPHAEAKAYYNISYTLTFYVAPLVVIGVCYGRMAKLLWHSFSPQYGDTEVVATQMFMRRKIAVMILIVVICFAACWFTYHFHDVLVALNYLPYLSFNQIRIISRAGRFLGAMNSALNPFLYAFLSENFRRCFYRAFPCVSKLSLGSSSFVQRDPDEKTMYSRRSVVGRYNTTSRATRLTSIRSVRHESGSPKPQQI